MPTREYIAPVILEKVTQLIADKLDKKTQPFVVNLSHALFSNVSHTDLLPRQEADLFGAVVSLWQHLQAQAESMTQAKKTDLKPSVKVFNPSLRQNGWKSSHTVVEIVLPDMAFLVDSIKMTLMRCGLTSHFMANAPVQVEVDTKGEIKSVAQDKGGRFSLFHIEIDRIDDAKQMQALQAELLSVLEDTKLVVQDWEPMVKSLNQVIDEIKAHKHLPIGKERLEEALAFLDWLGDHNFTFMGYKEFILGEDEGEEALLPTKQAPLGIFKVDGRVRTTKLSEFSQSARLEARKAELLILTKGNAQSRIHRPAYTDYIGIKKFDDKGKVIGEYRFTGLYTSAVYNQSVENIPLIRDKVARILDNSSYLRGSHSWKALHNILENYPRDELLQAGEDELLEVGMGVVQMQDRDLLRLFVRPDPFGRFFSCMVYVSKERYTTALRIQTQALFKRYFKTDQEVEFTTYFSESPLARTHYIVRVDSTHDVDIDVSLIEKNLMEISTSWDDRLKESMLQSFGENKGTQIAKAYQGAFPPSYKEVTLAGATAVADVERLESLTDTHKLEMLFYRPQEEAIDSKSVRLKLYHKDEPIHLSDVMPMLENFGLVVIGESPYQIQKQDGSVFWVLDFSMQYTAKALDLNKVRDNFQDAFAKVWQGALENDGFNRLLLASDLNGREITILRAYARYMRQVGFPFSQQYIEETLTAYPMLAKRLVEYFTKRFDPKAKSRQSALEKLEEKFIAELERVESLDDDRILRRYLEMMQASLRTNYFQTLANGEFKPWLSIKLSPKQIPEIPAPVPAFEIFVYAPDVEGVHLRGGKVARGGLRWSDRPEDFRTEILGLVKAQQVKNTVIVPVGAKGGFVCKRQHLCQGRDAIFAEGQRCYQTFIRALLDVSDNIIDEKIVAPKNVVRHDEDDAYLVVAADKGTATFSDLANQVSAEYNFWLGDAFASGGSNGYDHKAMGITAKGAWESVKRHFREMGVDCQTTDFTCIAIGDMAGDVFGNGMLLSKHIRLQAAFNHLHIFIDPNPDAAKSYVERERLFNLPRSSWEDYDKSLISEGGGIFSRKAKSIKLSPQIQAMLNTQKSSLAPNELIKALLQMQVDLLWNGGIGTYVKATSETHIDVGDRANDNLRVNGSELGAKIVGEGGNLGMTQRARMEYALYGGRVNTDFVDNVGGVDCSDNEVNIKILLNSLVAAGDLTLKQRNQVLESMEDEVGEIVLEDAYLQAESISVTQWQGSDQLKTQLRFIHALEKQDKLDRALEYLPDDETLLEREKQGQGLTRPELAVLVAYAKMVLKEQLIVEGITQDSYYESHLSHYFPSKIRKTYASAIAQHSLRPQLIATSLANQVVNEMGATYVMRMVDETGADVEYILHAYSCAREIFDFGAVFEQIRQLDNKVNSALQYELLSELRRMIRRISRWLLRNRLSVTSLAEVIDTFKADVTWVVEHLDDVLVAKELKEHQQQAKKWQEQGVPQDLAVRISRFSSLYSALDMNRVAVEAGVSISVATRLYFLLGDKLSLHSFLKQINQQSVENHWQALARASFREDLDWQQRQLTVQVLQCESFTTLAQTKIEESELVSQSLSHWMHEHKEALGRWEAILTEFNVGSTHESAKFSVALRELMLLNLNCSTNQ